ncbi:MAG: NAD(P)H-hydrate dehydratase [Anaerolineae bacterium]|nr:NAD(P)H-hydrate dehydratase [Anaerolineae bacterium]
MNRERPLYIVTTAQMQAAEKAADASGLSYAQMMENAGRAVAQAIETHFDPAGARALILVGPGNNGGDGLVAARYLARAGVAVTVYVWKRHTAEDKNWKLLSETGVERVFWSDDSGRARLTQLLNECGVIVDALLGTGVSRPIEGSLAELLDHVKAVVAARRAYADGPLVDPTLPAGDDELDPAIVALDVPSGLNSDTGAVDPHTLAADLTVTLAAVKRGHILMPGPTVVGQLVVGDIEILAGCYPAEVTLEMVTGAKVARLLPPRPVDGHKGTFGTALVVAGSLHYTGAALLAGQAAYRSGAGLVTLASPKTVHPILAARSIETTYLPLPDQDGALAPAAVQILEERLAQVEAALIGPGLGQHPPTVSFLRQLLAGRDPLPPLGLDADALNILAQQNEWWKLLPPHCILTPHPGEMARLTGVTPQEVQAARLETACEMAAKWNQIVLLKGAHTIIAAPDGRTMVLPFANPALAKAGSGDVLAGAIVGLLAQGLAPFAAAEAGAYLHGLCGEIAREHLGVAAVVAGDLLGFLPMAMREVRGE